MTKKLTKKEMEKLLAKPSVMRMVMIFLGQGFGWLISLLLVAGMLKVLFLLARWILFSW